MKTLLQRILPRFGFPLLILAAATSSARADVLELKDGTVLKGTYLGGTAGTVRFETSLGTQVVARDQALALTFTGDTPQTTQPAAAPAVQVQTPQPAVAQPVAVAAPAGPATVPAGTLLLVRMDSQVTSRDAQGTRFSAHLDTNLMLQDRLVAPAGTRVFGRIHEVEQARRLVGRSKLTLGITEIEVGGKLYTVTTSNFAEAGDSSFRKTARNAAVGAVIGGALGDSDDAKKGAAIGLGASVLTQGGTITVPKTALLEFRLKAAVTIGA